MKPETNPRMFTVGHGNAPFQEIARLLHTHHVATVIDVRSVPFSKHAPDFRKSFLSEAAAASGLGYRWMGDRLGGDPGPRSSTDPSAESAPGSLRGAIAEVIALNTTGPVVLLCSERDPEHCHRRVVLAPRFEESGIEVFHILPDGAAHRHQPSLGI